MSVSYFDIVLNIHKRIESVGYKSSVGSQHPLVSFLSMDKLNSIDNVAVSDISADKIISNKIFDKNEYSKVSDSFTISSDTDKVLITNIFTEESGSINAYPLFYKHVIPTTHFDPTAGHKLLSLKLLDNTMFVTDTIYRLTDLDNGIFYNDLESSYSPGDGSFEVFYLQYTVRESTSVFKNYTVLLNNQLVFAQADYTDLSPFLTLLSTATEVYLVDELSTGYFVFTFAVAGEYALRKKESSRIQLLPPIQAEGDDPWYARVRNGTFWTSVNGTPYKYHIAEIYSQPFNPYVPYRKAIDESGTILNPNLIKTSFGNIFEDLFITVKIYDEEDVLLWAVTTDPSLHGTVCSDSIRYSCLSVGGSYGIRSVDILGGFIDIKGITLQSIYSARCTFHYECADLLLTEVNLNPTQNNEIINETLIACVIPDDNISQRTKNVYTLLADKNGRIIYTDLDFFNNTTELISSGPDIGKTLFYKNAPDWYLSPYVNFTDQYSVTVSGVYLILGEVSIINHTVLSNIDLIDVRQEGGGFVEGEEISKACNDFAGLDGTPFPGAGCYFIELPFEVSAEGGGEFDSNEIREVVEKHTAFGFYPVIRTYGIDPYITEMQSTTSGVYLEWTSHEIGTEFNVYTSLYLDGPWNLNSSYSQVPSGINSCTVSGLKSGIKYYFRIIGLTDDEEIVGRIVGPSVKENLTVSNPFTFSAVAG